MATTNYSLGTLTSTPTQRGTFLNDYYTQDVYSFRLNSTSSINLNLHNISVGDDADLRLFRDVNNNGVLDSGDVLMLDSRRSGNSDDSINYRAGAGNYLAVVDRYAPGSQGRLDYHLDLSATPTSPTSTNAPNLLPKETQLGDIRLGTILYSDPTHSQTINKTGWVGNNDTADTYYFKASSRGDGVRIRVSLTGLSSDADVRLVEDRDKDQIVDPGEVIASSTLGSTSNESFQISRWNSSLNQYDYFVQVYQFSGDTNYNLNMTFESMLM